MTAHSERLPSIRRPSYKHVTKTKTKCLKPEIFATISLFPTNIPSSDRMWKEILIGLHLAAQMVFTNQDTCANFDYGRSLLKSGNSVNEAKQSCGCSALKRNNSLRKQGTSLDKENKGDEIELKSFHQRTNQMVFVKGGKYTMGTNKPFLPMDGEGPAREVKVRSFYMDIYEVSNAEFELFVNSTGHMTEV